MQKVWGMKSAINLTPSPGSNVTLKPGFYINGLIGGKEFRIPRKLPKLLSLESQVTQLRLGLFWRSHTLPYGCKMALCQACFLTLGQDRQAATTG